MGLCFCRVAAVAAGSWHTLFVAEAAGGGTVCPPELKVRTPAHTKQPGWYDQFESRVTQVLSCGWGAHGQLGHPQLQRCNVPTVIEGALQCQQHRGWLLGGS